MIKHKSVWGACGVQFFHRQLVQNNVEHDQPESLNEGLWNIHTNLPRFRGGSLVCPSKTRKYKVGLTKNTYTNISSRICCVTLPRRWPHSMFQHEQLSPSTLTMGGTISVNLRHMRSSAMRLRSTHPFPTMIGRRFEGVTLGPVL